MKTILLLLTTTCLAGCVSIQSSRSSTASAPGLYYYMPKKDFVITVTMDTGPTKVTFSETTAYPDLSARYLLSYSKNPVGKNTMTVVINEHGLLSSTTSETTSGISDLLKGVASTAGALAAFNAAQEPGKPKPTCPKGDNLFVVEAAPGNYTFCDVSVSVMPMGAQTYQSVSDPGEEAVPGIYYRESQPYLVQAKGGGVPSTGSILFSPSKSPTYVLPISPAFFANAKADFGFTDGVPTKFNQDSDGEVVALFKLPADVIAAYFSAIGATFDNFTTADSKQAGALSAQTKLDLAKQKYSACLAAIKAKDATLIASLGC